VLFTLPFTFGKTEVFTIPKIQNGMMIVIPSRKKIEMNKEEMIKEINEELSNLKDHADALSKLIEDLQATVHPTGDVKHIFVCRCAHVFNVQDK
jgi:hypothetical protein